MTITKNLTYFITFILVFYWYIVIFLNIRVKPVFNSIFRTPFKAFTNLWPFGAKLAILFYYFKILRLCPFLFINFGIKIIYETLTYLFATFGTKNICNCFPVISILLKHFLNDLILSSTPYFLRLPYFNYSTISMKTLILVSIFYHFRNFAPFFRVFRM